VDGQSLRVLSVPLQVGQRPAGTLMVGAELALVDLIQRYILTVMVWGLLAAVLLVGLSVWRSTYRALEPLEEVSDTAVQITKADDLAMRIPYRGPKNDEVGQLIQAFNQTLEQLEDLFNTQRQFISDVSHELRTPLTVIKGNLDVLREIECIDHESFDTINEEVNRLSRLVNDLLYLAQAESGQLPLEEQEVALDTLMLEVYQQALTLAGESIQVEIEALDQVLVQGDQDRLKQVLLNLVSNAVKYTPAGGEVRLKLWKDQRSAYFAVRDTGPGIKAEDLPHIFKRFYRTEKARTRSKDSGFGLGLAIAYWIVEHHRGEIKVDTEVGRGTTFTVRLPLADPREED
jgi:signal transduction histidine kinase